MRKISVISFIACLWIAGFAGCKKSDQKIVARSGSITVTTGDYMKELSNLPASYHSYLQTLEGKKQFLDILLREKILLNAAEKSGVDRRKEIQKNMSEYEQRMKEQEKEFRRDLIEREYLRDLQDGELKVSEQELKFNYEQNKDTYQNPVKATVSHILCPTEEGAQAALERVRRGEDFAKVAREVSTDPSAVRGGLIGEVSRGDLSDLPEFENLLFKLKPGQVAGVVKTKIGYHVIKMMKEERLPSQSFEAAAPLIRRVLEKKKFDQWVEKAKKDQNLTVDETVLASIVIPSPREPMVPAAAPNIQTPQDVK